MGGKRITQEDFISQSINVHGEVYDYSLVKYINKITKVEIICLDHGVFEQTPKQHLKGRGCFECGKIKCVRSSNTDEFITKSINIHGNKYDYSLVEYKTNRDKVKIICPEHGEFKQSPSHHLNGQGCPVCRYIKSGLSGRLSQKQCINDFISVHGDKYDYSLVKYNTDRDKIKIICSEHGVFEQTPNNHKTGQGCPVCVNSISKQEIELQEWLSDYVNTITNDRKLISPLELDIVIPSHKIAIEYNGIYWHSEQRGKDKKYHLNKYLQCKDKGYRLIQIWENEWINKQDIVKSIILSALGIFSNKIHGRKCDIKTVNVSIARQFYNDNHIQGFKGGEHHGLYYNDELVSLMTINNLNILERFANKQNTLIYGGFSKLLKSFDNIDNLITFADIRYFTGKVYDQNGFEYQYNSDPNYFYFKGHDMVLYSRVQFQKHKLKNRLDIFDSNLTEYQNMINNGYDRIWDCGNMKYIYKG